MVLTLHVYRKLSPDGKISLYVGQRDYIDHLTHVDPIGGVIVIETDVAREERVFVQLVLTYRYGREEDEVMGLTFAKEIVITSNQIFPKIEEETTPSPSRGCEENTSLQERLLKKFGKKAHPFHMVLPPDAPASVTLQPVQDDMGRPCGVQWELRAFVAETDSAPPRKKSCIRMGIRRQQFSQPKEGRQPVGTCAKEFLLSPGKVHLTVTLDRQIYYHGEPISVFLCVTNRSHKQVKKMKISAIQLCDVSLGVSGTLRHIISTIETQEGCPVLPNADLEKSFILTPTLEDNKDKRGLAIQSNYFPQEPCLASSTLFSDPDQRDVFGVVVSYVVRVKVWMGALAGEMATEVPFTLMNPPPLAPPPPLIVPQLRNDSIKNEKVTKKENESSHLVVSEGQGPAFSDTEPDTENSSLDVIRKGSLPATDTSVPKLSVASKSMSPRKGNQILESPKS